MGFVWVFFNWCLQYLLTTFCLFSCMASMVDTSEAARCGDMGVGERKAKSVLLDLERQKKKQVCLLHEVHAAQRKVLQKKRPLEEASCKHQRD